MDITTYSNCVIYCVNTNKYIVKLLYSAANNINWMQQHLLLS